MSDHLSKSPKSGNYILNRMDSDVTSCERQADDQNKVAEVMVEKCTQMLCDYFDVAPDMVTKEFARMLIADVLDCIPRPLCENK
jgi:hypothetical protein